METLKKVEEFVAINRSRGDGSGSGIGYGYGDSTGSCYGYCDIKSFYGCPVYLIDGVQTIIDRIRGNVARGRLLCDDLTTKDCFIVKQGNMFAHGETLHRAMRALQDKLFDDMPEEERIAEFIKCHDLKSEYSARDLWEWHHRLTGSCEMGRNQFAEEHAIDINTTKLTVKDFIELTRYAYGGSVICNLEKAYKAVINDD